MATATVNKEVAILQVYLKQLAKFPLKNFNSQKFGEIVDTLGSVNFRADAQLVAAKDPAEMERIASGFIAEKLGIADMKAAHSLMKKVTLKMDKEKRKYRAVYYYMLWDAQRAMKK
jgi:hypothetical protein